MNSGSHCMHDLYKYYKSQDTVFKADYKLFRAIIIDFGTLVSKALLEQSKQLIMPYRLGIMQVVKYRPKTYTHKSLSVDFLMTKKLGKVVYHLNEHSNGFKVRLYWQKAHKFENYKKYAFIMTRANKRMLAFLFKNKITDYPEL